MRRRLYFILPDTTVSEKIEDELLLARIDDGHIHFLSASESSLGSKLPKASVLQKTDFYHAMAVGIVAGGLTGSIIGVLLLLNPAWSAGLGNASTLGMVLGLSVGGAVFGCWVSGMIGISCPSTRLKAFQKAIDQGNILLMVDVPKERVKEITQLIKSHHPEADAKGIEATIPAFP